MDVVYIVRPDDHNPELRVSLRTVAEHLPHDQVFVVGHTPSWVTGVHSLQTIQGGTKYANSTRNVLTACCTRDISDPFILMNDDFFILEPIDQVPTLHRGPVIDVLEEYRRRTNAGHYVTGMLETLELLYDLGHDEPLSYELHVPLVVSKNAMRDAIEEATRRDIPVPHKRTLYGNLTRIGGTQIEDVKVTDNALRRLSGPFVSTSDHSYRHGWIGRHLEHTFDRPGPYEIPVRKRSA